MGRGFVRPFRRGVPTGQSERQHCSQCVRYGCEGCRLRLEQQGTEGEDEWTRKSDESESVEWQQGGEGTDGDVGAELVESLGFRV